MPHVDEQHKTWIGRMLADASGHRIGRIDDIYVDDDTGRPEWLAVSPGLLGPGTHFVPVRGATVSGRGVQVPYSKDQVKVAPGAGAGGRLSRMEKGRLYAHYGCSYAEERNRLQLSLGRNRPGPSRPPDGRPDPIRTADERLVTQPPDRGDGTPPSRPPPAPPIFDRGRWPDDEAIFGLIDEVAGSGT